MDIGTIVASSSHLTYVCRIYGDRDVSEPPTQDDHGVGSFVKVALEPHPDRSLVGLIADSAVLNPDYGNFGPRLSTTNELRVFSPDTLDERGIVVVIQVLGYEAAGRPRHGIPPWTAHAGSTVSLLDLEAVVNFHRSESGKLMMEYQPRLSSANDPVINSLMLATINQLEPSFPDQKELLSLLRSNLAWQTTIAPMTRR